MVLSFLQLPGRTTFDTKLDLVVDPLAFLGRALHLWNPAASGGELQNQAYGYLFPMGPFFVLGDLAGLPPWVTQRLWCALLLSLAYGGALAVARALRVGTEPARHVGALAYALAPRVLTEIGPLTAETLAAVMLPWVLLPLIRARRPRRAAALSGLAVLGMGGVNGAVVVMALVLPGLWLLTRRWTRAHARLVAWWVAAVTAAVLWWFLPLVLLGQYSLPFVDYVESATNTTSPTSLFQVLRGTNQWVAYVVQGTPWWPAGFLLVDNPALMAATGLLAAVALAGLARAGLPERLFLTLGVITGAVLLTIGYVGALDSPLSETVRGLLDGPLAPLRNVHKFEPGLRLPLALALVHAITAHRRPGRVRWAVGAALVLVAAAPAWLLTLRPGPGWDEIPRHWHEATAWLAQADGRTLLVPGTGFAEYTWGRPIDEPIQALARSPWALRSQIPLGSEGNTRLMDAVEDALADGRGAPGLADFLARSGHRYLLLRNDVDRANVPPLDVLRQALARSPGLTKVAAFGALEVYRVDREVPRAIAVVQEDVATVSGGPESLLPLLDSGLLDPARPTVLAGDGGAPHAADWLVTDGLRNRERNVGRMRDNLGQTLTADEPPRQVRPALDVLPFDGLEHRTVAVHRGIRGVTASSSAGYADSVRGSDLASMPFAALDDDPYTAWQSSTVDGPVGQWLEVTLDTPRVVTAVGLRVVDDRRVGWPVSHVRIATDAGEVEHEVARGAGEQRFPVVAGLTGRVRVTVAAVAAGRVTGNVGIAELDVPGVEPQRALRVPQDVTPTPGQRTSFAFTRGSQPRYACLRTGVVHCDASLARFGEEPQGLHRLFHVPAPATYTVTGTVLPAGGASPPLDLPGLSVAASTQLAGDPGAAPLHAIDGDPATTWIADHTDQRPVLRLTWDRPRTITGLRLTTTPGSGASAPSEVDISTTAGTVRREVGPRGAVAFAGTTDRLEIAVTRVGPGTGPPGITGLELDGVTFPVVDPDTPITVPCGRGPTVRVDGITYDTSVSGTVRDVVEHRPLPLATCPDLTGGLELTAGEHELRTGRSADFLVQDLWLRPVVAQRVLPRHRRIDVTTWTAAHREIRVADGLAAVLAVPENANDGWVATLDGQPLPRTRVDGWQQAWRLPSGPVTVVLEFHPDHSYRTRLLVGALAVLLLLAAALLPARSGPRTGAADGRWVSWLPAALLVVLGGMAGLVALLACLFLRSLVPRRRRAVSMLLAFGGMAVATAVSVTGRVLGHGQDWAYGTAAQAAVLVALAGVVSARVRWFERA